MLIVPTLPGPVGTGVAGAEDDGAEGVLGRPEDGVAALPVWAVAENVSVTAIASRTLKTLLFIGLIELLGTWFRK
jgi:hypothetical protein